MAWTSTQVTQNGNSTVTWSIGPHASVSTRDAIVLKPESGSSRLELTSNKVRQSPTNYNLTVQVHGSEAVAYRFAAEQMN